MRPIDRSEFHVRVGDILIIVPCLEFVLYLDITEDTGVLDFYHRTREALGDRITYYQAESMKGYSRLTARGESMVPTWFTKPRIGKVDYYMSLSDGDPNAAVSASTIELSIFRRPAQEITAEVKADWQVNFGEKKRIITHPGSFLRVTLPLDHPLADPAKAVDWFLDFSLLKTGRIFAGHCGYALNYYGQPVESTLYEPAKKALASLVMRYPGLGWNGGAVLPRILRYEPGQNDFVPLIKRANWLTVACDKTLDCIGGRALFQNLAGGESALTLIQLEHGLAIQAGPEPQIGDLGHRDFLPLYRRVASALRAIRIPELDGAGAGFMRIATNEWLNALDKEYE